MDNVDAVGAQGLRYTRMPDLKLTERLAVKLNILPAAIYDAFPLVLFGRLLVLSSKLGVFESLHRTPQTVGELSRSLHLHPQAGELICRSLEASKYLRRRGEHYHLAPQAAKWLVHSSPHYVGNFLSYIELLHSHWMYLEETLKRGSPPQSYVQMFSPAEWELYTLGMMDLAKLVLPHLLPKLRIPPSARTLLDLCGSHGLYTIELCKRHHLLQVTIADLPQVLTTTRQILNEHKMHERIATMPCDILNTSLPPASFDVVLAFNIIHGFDEAINGRLVRAAAQTLRPGGSLYILDQLEDPRSSGADRLIPLMMGLNLLNEIGGRVYTFKQVRAICSAAGLAGLKLYRLRIPGVSLILAKKPMTISRSETSSSQKNCLR